MRNAVSTVTLTSCRPSSPSATSLTVLDVTLVPYEVVDRGCGSSGSSSGRSLRSVSLGLAGVEVCADEVVDRRAVEGASESVVLVALREELEQVEGPLLPLVGVDVLQHPGRPAVLGDHDRAVPVRRAGDELRGAALERRDGSDIAREVHDAGCSPEFGRLISFREWRLGRSEGRVRGTCRGAD